MRHLAVLSLHTSPLVQPGTGDGGGMNVYVRELASALALAGGRSTVFTRRVEPSAPTVVEVEPGFRVVHVDAGEPDLSKEELEGEVGPFTDGVAAHLDADPSFDGLLANYWLSGVAGHRLKHQLDLPLTTTFHTLARVKAETGDLEPQRRVDAEAEVVGCSDVILASSAEEVRQLVDHYGAEASRIEIIPPGVDHAYFSPGPRAVARRITGLGYGPVLAFVGRIQPLKGLDVAVPAWPLWVVRMPDWWWLAGLVAPTASRKSGGFETWPTTLAWPGTCTSSHPSPTTSLLPGPGRPTWWSCRAARSRSGSSPWRPRPAGSLLWLRTLAACGASSTTVGPATWSRVATRTPTQVT